jgi:type IV pilus assembly protein PilE
MNNKGFSLVELMVVLAIIGVLGAIGYPSYDSYMKKSRRSDAKIALQRMADRQERFYLQNNTYTAATANVGGTGTEKNYYVLSIDPAADVNGFTLIATAVPGEAQANDTTTNHGDCRVLQLTSAGAKTPDLCW